MAPSTCPTAGRQLNRYFSSQAPRGSNTIPAAPAHLASFLSQTSSSARSSRTLHAARTALQVLRMQSSSLRSGAGDAMSVSPETAGSLGVQKSGVQPDVAPAQRTSVNIFNSAPMALLHNLSFASSAAGDDAAADLQLAPMVTGVQRREVTDCYTLLRRLGGGAAGEVFEAQDKAAGHLVAVKVFLGPPEDALLEAITEHVCLSRVASPYVLTSYELMNRGTQPALVFELAPRSLGQYLRELRGKGEQGTASAAPAEARTSHASESTHWTESSSGSVVQAPGETNVDEHVDLVPELLSTKSGKLQSGDFGIASSASLPMSVVLRVMSGLLSALATSHSAGLAHCDIKPDNILLMHDGSPRLSDFGAASAIDPDTGRVRATTASSATAKMAERRPSQERERRSSSSDAMPEYSRTAPVRSKTANALQPLSLRAANVGTDAYSAPERGHEADMRRVDVWALGCVLYEMLIGKPLLDWKTQADKFAQMYALQSAGWTPPQLPAYAAAWQPVLNAMLNVDPEQRLLPDEILRLRFFDNTRTVFGRGPMNKAYRGRPARSSLLMPTGARPDFHINYGDCQVRRPPLSPNLHSPASDATLETTPKFQQATESPQTVRSDGAKSMGPASGDAKALPMQQVRRFRMTVN